MEKCALSARQTGRYRIGEYKVDCHVLNSQMVVIEETEMGSNDRLRRCLWAGIVLGMPTAASARPDDGTGLFAFDAADELSWVDSLDGVVRVHYSTAGPNVTLLDDEDGDGVPDFPVLIAEEVSSVLTELLEHGFRPPVAEADLGLGPLGGSDAIDVYLVDFGGSADGQFAVDRCRGGVCAGHMLIENDFAGYGYASLAEVAHVLASHELFHGVQFAYVDELDPWFSEGTATWAEHLLEPEVNDYLRFCKAYLGDAGRSIDRPPAGTITSFSYGTALFFGFVQERHSADPMVAMLELLADAGDGDEVAAIGHALEEEGDQLSDAWVEFVTWNLATGRRSGIIDSYPYAAGLAPGITAEEEGSYIEDDHRFYPLAASYFRIDHPGGELLLSTLEDNNGAVIFRVFPVADGSADSDIGPALVTWSPTAQETLSLGEQPAGGYWLLGTYPQVATESAKRVVCFGGPSAMEGCARSDEDTGAPAGDSGLGDSDTDAGQGPDGGSDGAEADTDGTAKSGCAVGPAGAVLGWSTLLGVLMITGRRRQRHA